MISKGVSSDWTTASRVLREKFRNKKVLITGGLGFVGSNLAIRLVDYGSDGTLYTKTLGKMRNVKEIVSNVRIVQGDVTDYESLVDLVAGKDYVFHLAAQTSNISSMKSPMLDLEVNVKGTLNILEACRRNNPRATIVSVGTTTQIGKPMRIPVDETHPERPLTVYDADKLVCEKYFHLYHSAFGLQTVFLRFPTLFGERQEVRSSRTGVVNSFIGKAMLGKTITIFGDGKFLRDFVHVENVVDALVLSAIAPSAAGEAFIVSSGRGVPFVTMVKTVISAVKESTGRDAHYQHAPWPNDWKMVDVGSYVGTYEKLNRITSWCPRISFEEGIRRTVDFYSRRIQEYLQE